MTTHTRTITLDREQAQDCLYRLGLLQFWRDYGGADFYEVVSIGGFQERYIDADDRPGDTSHDGNGWTRTVREYVVSTEPATGEDRARLDDLRDTRAALGDVDRRFLDALSATERASFVAAHLAAHRSRGKRVQRDGRGGWEAVPYAPAPVLLDDDRL